VVNFVVTEENLRIHERQRRFILMDIFFNKPFEYGYDGIFKLLRWMQNLHHSTWDHKILYADRSSED
jgi:hypothetical protein